MCLQCLGFLIILMSASPRYLALRNTDYNLVYRKLMPFNLGSLHINIFLKKSKRRQWQATFILFQRKSDVNEENQKSYQHVLPYWGTKYWIVLRFSSGVCVK